MPKQATSSTAKVKQICQKYPEEFSATSAGYLRCNLCEVLVKCDKKFFVEWQPRKIGDEASTEPFYFKVSVCYVGKVLPSETAAQACVAKLASQKNEQIQELLLDENFL